MNSPTAKLSNRLSLDDFKSASSTNEAETLESISGGVLGACHCETTYTTSVIDWGIFTFYYSYTTTYCE